jgi:asparagine synthase (glutamine-hydrolysing)
LDSSVVAALARDHAPHLDTFSIAFSDPAFDESAEQRRMASFLGTPHQEVFCTPEDIGQVFPDVIRHTETPVLRTAPAPMFILSSLVRQHGYKVVLTGEGADEFLAGYDLFKETQIRRFWARQPESRLRPLLLRRLYPEIPRLADSAAFTTAFFKRRLHDTASPFYSHLIRWGNSLQLFRFLADDVRGAHETAQDYSPVALPEAFHAWPSLTQAQYLEITTFLSPYLLSSQGDRMAMAHSVEGRYPFLDHRMVGFCSRLPANLKLRGLSDKQLLRQLGRSLLPVHSWQRRKRPYRAPIQRCFFRGERALEYVEELTAPEAVRRGGYFKPSAVEFLTGKARGLGSLSEVEEMALVGIISTQLVDYYYVRRAWQPTSLGGLANVKVVDLSPASV